ncbi:MAG: hypothetical protein JSV63_03565 [Candidatus Aenigmatarchaeota archaeon]|nr:MAG: hypothetical protein JSV63_03565 [Candidatus Aenigmarchaeota archaeon]
MGVTFGPGFMVLENGDEIIWVTPHSGPALETPTSRDQNSDTVASLCWLKAGGKYILSTMPRKRALGIDFNRDPPPLKKSLEYYPLFMKDIYPEKLAGYREKYAWCASDSRDHAKRLKIYNDFWSALRGKGKTVVFLHTKFTRLKNFPSIMDIIAYEDYGFSRDILAPIIRNINRKYSGFLHSISENYKHAIILQEKRISRRIAEIYGSFDTSTSKVEYKTNLMGDLRIIRKYADKRRVGALKKQFNSINFMLAVKSALKNAGTPKVTIESIFRGSHARSQAKVVSRRRNVISIELNGFLNQWYPHHASDMVLDIVNAIRPMTKITQYFTD